MVKSLINTRIKLSIVILAINISGCANRYTHYGETGETIPVLTPIQTATDSVYRYKEPFSELNRSKLTTNTLIEIFGQPAKVSHDSHPSFKEEQPADLAYRYYFATRDGNPGAKIFYFYKGQSSGENVLGGLNLGETYRLLNSSDKTDKKLITKWITANRFVW